jgi:hypothetical protein
LGIYIAWGKPSNGLRLLSSPGGFHPLVIVVCYSFLFFLGCPREDFTHGKRNFFIMSQEPPVIQAAELLKHRWLSTPSFEIDPSRLLFFEFKAGQTLLLIHKALKRDYSLVSTQLVVISTCTGAAPLVTLSTVIPVQSFYSVS